MRGLKIDTSLIEEMLAKENDLNLALFKAKSKLIEIDKVLLLYPSPSLKEERIKINKFLLFFYSKKYEYSLSQLKIRAPQLFGSRKGNVNEI